MLSCEVLIFWYKTDKLERRYWTDHGTEKHHLYFQGQFTWFKLDIPVAAEKRRSSWNCSIWYMNPFPSSPMRWLCGTRTSSKNISAVSELCIPNLDIFRVRCTPAHVSGRRMTKESHQQSSLINLFINCSVGHWCNYKLSGLKTGSTSHVITTTLLACIGCLLEWVCGHHTCMHARMHSCMHTHTYLTY